MAERQWRAIASRLADGTLTLADALPMRMCAGLPVRGLLMAVPPQDAIKADRHLRAAHVRKSALVGSLTADQAEAIGEMRL